MESREYPQYERQGGYRYRRQQPKVETSQTAKDEDLAKRLWDVSEKMTEIKFAWPVQVAS